MKKILFEKKISLIWVFLLLIIFLGTSSFIFHKKEDQGLSNNIEITNSLSHDCVLAMDQIRGGRSAFVKPLILADVGVQDKTMYSLKSEIQSIINQKIQNNGLQVASIYIRKMDNGSHISLNENEVYNPASLMKIAYLISYLVEEDLSPGKLQKKLFFNKHFTEGNNQNIVDFKLTENSYYTISELLHAMVVFSDNDATTVLMQNLNNTVFTKIFSDLQLPPPPKQGEYFIGVDDYAKFFRVLYNSSYLSTQSSEFAIGLLLKSSFRDGICSTLSPDIPVAHKFGERVLNSVAQLHEFGIVYLNNEPYLIGVMSKGSNLSPLKEAMGEISRVVYNYMKINS